MESLQLNHSCIVQQSEWRQESNLPNPKYCANFKFSGNTIPNLIEGFII